MEELKPCPFCGKKPVWHVVGEANDLLKFGCPDGCVEWIQAFTKPYYENALQTLETRWNRRAAPENKPLTCKGCESEDSEEMCNFCSRAIRSDYYTRKPEGSDEP